MRQMSFDKEYPNRKDWRAAYYDNRRFDGWCRNHGKCDWCRRSRTWFDWRRRLYSDQDIEEWRDDDSV